MAVEDDSTLDNLNRSNERTSVSFGYDLPKKKSKLPTIILIIVLVVALGAVGFFFRSKINGLFSASQLPSSTPEATEIPTPTPTPNPLTRSDWSFEILNGSGVSGLAKTVASKLQGLGYEVTKTGNADKNNYQKTQIWVKKDHLDKVDLVIADLKDTIKIASIAGELKEGTASARIIIGKDTTQ